MSLRPVCRAPKPCLAVLLFLLAWPAFGVEWKQFELLNGRITISLPEGSRDEARGHDIMAAPESDESETRMVFDEGEKRLVVMTMERFSRAGKDYEAQVAKELEKTFGGRKGNVAVSSVGPHLFVGTPKVPKGKEAILYADAYVRDAEGCIVEVCVYFNPKFHETPARCVEMSKQIVGSIALGKRPLNVAGGSRSFAMPGGENKITVTLPPGWIAYPQPGVDFFIHHLAEVTELGTAEANIGIYLGWFPSSPFHEKLEGKPSFHKAVRKSKLFGNDLEWTEYSEPKASPRKHIEITTDVPAADMKTHVFASAPNAAGIAQILKIMATANVEKHAKVDPR